MADIVNVTGNGTFGGIGVEISPFARPAAESIPTPVQGDFASTSDKQPGGTINIAFDLPVNFVSITIHSSNYLGNKMVAYDEDGNELASVDFAWGIGLPLTDATLGRPVNTKEISYPGIRRIDLVAGETDYVYYGDFQIRSQYDLIGGDGDVFNLADQEVSFPLSIRAIPVPTTTSAGMAIRYDIKPELPVCDMFVLVNEAILSVQAIPIEYQRIIETLSRDLLSGKVKSYFDDQRELKTLLNFGNDTQILLTNWQWSPDKRAENEFLVKLYEPLAVDVEVKTPVWISREISPPLIDAVNIFIIPADRIFVFLRPPNFSFDLLDMSGFEIIDATLEQLIPSGSIVVTSESVSLQDNVLEQYYTSDFDSARLNVDYTDYNNFVHFSSAAARLTIFKQKLTQIEILNAEVAAQELAASASLANGSTLDAASNYKVIESLLEEKQQLIRDFDGYERFLYYDSGSFSGSLSGLEEDLLIEIENVSWPKDGITNLPLATTSSAAVTYFDYQVGIAGEYDDVNQEWLIHAVPAYLQDDADSEEYLTFLNMIGHHFDLIKLYIDDMTEIYDRSANPAEGISSDLLWTVAESMGIKLPNQYAIKSLVDYSIGTAAATQETYRQAIAETWKRFLHNQIFLAKTKGTRTNLETLRNTYGVLPEVLRVRESVVPSSIFVDDQFETFDENTNVLAFENTASLEIPFGASGLFSPFTIELRFGATALSQSFTSSFLMHGDNAGDAAWGVSLHPTGTFASPNKKGYVRLVSGSEILAQSDVGNFFSGDFFSLMIRQNDAEIDLEIKRYEDGQFKYESSNQINGTLTASFSQSNNIYLGAASGTTYAETGSAGIKHDEFRLWTEVISDETFDQHVKFPGMYAGNVSGSSLNYLVFRHSFNIPQDLLANPVLPNETPSASVGSLTASFAAGFETSSAFPYNMEKVVRQTQRFTPNAGTQYSSNKIRVDPPILFKADAVIVTGSSTIPVLSRDRLIRATATSSVETDISDDVKSDAIVAFYLTLAETINDSILRSLGNVDLSNLIGDPNNLYESVYTDLLRTYQFYVENYAPNFDYNQFARLTEDLLNSLFEQALQNVPAQSKTLTGIVIEPTLLERNRVVLNRPLQVEGEGTKRAQNAETALGTAATSSYNMTNIQQTGRLPSTWTLDALIEEYGSIQNIEGLTIPVDGDIDQMETAEALGLYSPIDAIISEDEEGEVLAELSQNNALILLENILEPLALFTEYPGLILLESETELLGEYPVYDWVIDLGELIRTDISAVTGDDFAPQTVVPASDFTDPKATTFFDHISGSFGIRFFVKEVRFAEARIRDRGNWVAGTVYQTNDVVTQVNQSGSARLGNDQQFRCLVSAVVSAQQSVPFVSNVAPYLDTFNWTPVTYLTTAKIRLYKAIVSGSSPTGPGDIAIVPFSQPGTPFTGYSPKHYRFHRDTGTAYNRARYVGCLQTVDTTIDGKDPVEISPSSDRQLVVTEGTPIVRSDEEGGPILDVK
jgi:hypothetical protein